MNYRKNRKLCDLLGHLTAGENLQIEAGSIYTKRSSWSKKYQVHVIEQARGKIYVSLCIRFVPRDCSDFPQESVSGVYTIYPKDTKFDVYCDMETAGFGWTVFQRRINGTIDFYKGWSDYEIGFGNLKSEFWLGNKFMNLLTSTAKYKLYIQLEDFEGNSRYAEYSEFSIGDAATNYILNVDGYSGNAGDSLSHPGDQNHNGMMFSTTDRDNDRSTGDCATKYKGAWWYNACHMANLNGEYLGGQYSTGANGIVWWKWKGYQYSLKSTKIMIKRH
ncbi:microfibril-associated glycoprotein 4-like [Mytilus californianus]|uniref:microfibril-associated glycoprotein 4-like n=1 Tax=Mytilus californianus TaxID=6549 RepID=UPI002246BC75|nr:microfibril-associated glycoprotein 4-like [Mytilus californianus]